MDLSILNPEQARAVRHTEGPLLVLAGAGSGKTRVLTHRIAYLIEQGVSPYAILALTFTNKAAAEMRERVESLVGPAASGMWVMTFHSACARILRMDIPHIGYDKSFVIYDDADQQSLLKKIIRDLELNDKVFAPRALSSAISDAKNHSLRPMEYMENAYQPEEVRRVFSLYEKHLKECNALDFDDLLLKTLALFDACPDVLEKYRNRFQYILVDEYQDTNMAQYHIVRLLSAAHQNLCVVGDDDQSIYGWRGADIRNILEFEKDFPRAEVVRLEQNYRSTAKILEAANLVIANNHGRKPKKLWTDRGGGAPIETFEGPDERDEALFICNQIASQVRGGDRRYDDFAILYRTHAQSRVLEMTLKNFDIPYHVYGGLSFFQRAEVKDILAYLRLLYNPADDVAFLRVINLPRRGLGSGALVSLQEAAAARGVPLYHMAMDHEALPARIAPKFHDFCALMQGVYMQIGQKPLADVTEDLLARIGYDTYLREDRKENYETRAEIVTELINYIREFENAVNDPEADILQSFLENAALFSETDNMESDCGEVSLMTLHSAKGLEFPVVFIPGLEDGLFPSSRSISDMDKLEEERRLMYVGITRAREELFLTHACRRMVYGSITECAPSMFLAELAPALPESMQPRPVKKPRPVQPANRFSLTKPAPQPPKRTVLAAAPKTNANVSFTAGDRVLHSKFGKGTVTEIGGAGGALLVSIQFDDGTGKRFAAAYAPIEKI